MYGLLTTFDHAFVLSCDRPIQSVGDLPSYKDATIADAWDEYSVKTLEQFMNGQNPYDKTLYRWNIVLQQPGRLVQGNDPLQTTGFRTNVLDGLLASVDVWIANNAGTLATEAALDLASTGRMFNFDSDDTWTQDTRPFAMQLVHRLQPRQITLVQSWWDGLDDTVLSTMPAPAQRIFIARTTAVMMNRAGIAAIKAFIRLPAMLANERVQFIDDIADEAAAFEILNSFPIAERAGYLADLRAVRLRNYLAQCWNRGLFQRLALASPFPYRADVIAKMPVEKRRLALDLLSDTDRDAVVKALPQDIRGAHLALLPI